MKIEAIRLSEVSVVPFTVYNDATFEEYEPPMTAIAKRRSPIDDEEHIFDTLPDQGNWTEEEYLRLTDATNRLVEFTDGVFKAEDRQK